MRAICGLEVRGAQPKPNAEVTCFACGKRVRDTERPPPAPRSMAPVVVEGSRTIHLAAQVPMPFFVEKNTLGGREVDALVSLGPAGVTCRRCASLAKESA